MFSLMLQVSNATSYFLCILYALRMLLNFSEQHNPYLKA